jgi:hypothetical protein
VCLAETTKQGGNTNREVLGTTLELTYSFKTVTEETSKHVLNKYVKKKGKVFPVFNYVNKSRIIRTFAITPF